MGVERSHPPEQAPAQKPLPLASWHFDPQLFRKWPQVAAAEMGEMEHLAEQDVSNEVTLGL